MRRERNATLELFRVLLMLMVITLHYFYTGGVLDKLQFGDRNYILVWGVESLCLVAVNCYVMLSAWFLSQKGATWKKVLDIFLQVLFYSVGIYAVLCLMGYQSFQPMTFVTRYLFPIASGYNWFATVYVVYALLTPYLNKLGENMEKKELGRLVLILFIAFSAVPTVLFFTIDNLGVQGGYSLLWFIFLHYLTMYIRKYGVTLSKGKCLLIYFGSCAIPLAVKVGQRLLLGQEIWDLYRYNACTTVLGAAALFLFFLQLPERHSRFWCVLGSTTFGVLLIHTQYIIRTEILWEKIVQPLAYCGRNPGIFLVHLALSVALIFVVCSLIELLRQKLFALIKKAYIYIYIYPELINSRAVCCAAHITV